MFNILGYSSQRSLDDMINPRSSNTINNNNNNKYQRDEKNQRKSSNVSNKSLPENRVANFNMDNTARVANSNMDNTGRVVNSNMDNTARVTNSNGYSTGLPTIPQAGYIEENIYCNVNQGYGAQPSCKFSYQIILVHISIT